MPPDHIAKMKADVIEQFKECLETLRRAEGRLAGAVTSLDIESELTRLASKAGVKHPDRILHGVANYFDEFTPRQKKTLLAVLCSIHEDTPQRGRIHWSRYLLK